MAAGILTGPWSVDGEKLHCESLVFSWFLFLFLLSCFSLQL